MRKIKWRQAGSDVEHTIPQGATVTFEGADIVIGQGPGVVMAKLGSERVSVTPEAESLECGKMTPREQSERIKIEGETLSLSDRVRDLSEYVALRWPLRADSRGPARAKKPASSNSVLGSLEKVLEIADECYESDIGTALTLLAKEVGKLGGQVSKYSECGAEGTGSNSLLTTYSCGSSDYDQRPGMYRQSVSCKHRRGTK